MIRGARDGVDMVSRVNATHGAVGCDGRSLQVGGGVVGDDRALTRADVDADQPAAQRCTRSGRVPRRHHEPPVPADVEVYVSHGLARVRRQVARAGHVEQVRQRWSDVVVPVPHRVAGVQHCRDLGILAQLPQSLVVFDAGRGRQHGGADERDVRLPCGVDGVNAAGQFEDLRRLAANDRKAPQGSRRFLVLVGGARRDEQEVVACGERRRRLALFPVGQPPRRLLARGVQLPDGADELGALVVEFTDHRDDAGSVGRYRQAGHAWQGEEVVEIVERCRAHVPLVAHRLQSLDFYRGQFDFQTITCQADGVSTVPLADLPGRPCPIAASLELVGERWSLLVVREIAMGATRFSDIVRGTGAPRDRIAARLKTLASAGVVTRVPYQSAPPRDEYRLTDAGRALIPVLDALLDWGANHAVDRDDPVRPRRYRTIAEQAEQEERS